MADKRTQEKKSFDPTTIVLVLIITIGAFFLGTFWTKVKSDESGKDISKETKASLTPSGMPLKSIKETKQTVASIMVKVTAIIHPTLFD